MRKIKLTNGDFAIVDNDDYKKYSKYTWCRDVQGRVVGYLFSGKIKAGQGKSKQKKLHRVIMKAPIGVEVDHIHGNQLDNRKSKLRLATTSQNGMNKGPQSNNKSGVKGVCYSESGKVWRIYITLNGKTINRQRKSFKEAVTLRKKLALALHKEFAFENRKNNK